MRVKQSVTIKASGLANGDAVKSWTSNKPGVAAVKNGKITAVKTGTAKITVKLKSGLTTWFNVKVQKNAVKTASIKVLNKNNNKSVAGKVTLAKGKKLNLSVAVTPITSSEKVTFSSSQKKVASVSSKGVVTALKAGQAKITVKSGSKKVIFTVVVPKTATKSISGVTDVKNLKKGKTFTINVKVVPANSDYKVTYTSSNTKVAMVSAKGTVTAKKKGTAVITVKSGSQIKQCKVTVK